MTAQSLRSLVDVAADSFEERPAWGRGLLGHDQVTPTRDESRRSLDVSRVSFPFQMVIYLVSATIAGTLGVWAANSGQTQKIDALDAKFSLVLEKLASQQAVKEQESKLQDERMSNMRETVRKMEARIEMMQIQSAARDKEINDSLMLLKSRR